MADGTSYISEPPTNGKVVITTTLGELDVELWSKECPLTCRNFVQLCMEGYYDGCIFHTAIKGFMIQTGDPTGSGSGGESIFGDPFKDEFHGRLRYSRRGLVGMATKEKDQNQSQFFFTLGKSDWLNKKNTLFGKVTGDTFYNLLKYDDVEVDSDDRPVRPPKILKTEVIVCPFDDIVPRANRKKQLELEAEQARKKEQKKVKKNTSLLSFSDDVDAVVDAEMTTGGAEKGKSAFDLMSADEKEYELMQAATAEAKRKAAESQKVSQNLSMQGGTGREGKCHENQRSIDGVVSSVGGNNDETSSRNEMNYDNDMKAALLARREAEAKKRAKKATTVGETSFGSAPKSGINPDTTADDMKELYRQVEEIKKRRIELLMQKEKKAEGEHGEIGGNGSERDKQVEDGKGRASRLNALLNNKLFKGKNDEKPKAGRAFRVDVAGTVDTVMNASERKRNELLLRKRSQNAGSREDDTMAKLSAFKSVLGGLKATEPGHRADKHSGAVELNGASEPTLTSRMDQNGAEQGYTDEVVKTSAPMGNDSDDDEGWMYHKIQFQRRPQDFDLELQNRQFEKDYSYFDPRKKDEAKEKMLKEANRASGRPHHNVVTHGGRSSVSHNDVDMEYLESLRSRDSGNSSSSNSSSSSSSHYDQHDRYDEVRRNDYDRKRDRDDDSGRHRDRERRGDRDKDMHDDRMKKRSRRDSHDRGR